MFLREVVRKNADGSTVRYLQLVESVWDPAKKQPRPKILHSFGRIDAAERVDLVTLAESILRRLDPKKAAKLEGRRGDERAPEAATLPFGALYVLGYLWRRFEMDEVLIRTFREAGESDPAGAERAVFAMVAHMALSPGSKRACHRRWLAEEVHFQGAEKLNLGRLYTAMDLVDEHSDELQKRVFDQLASSLNVEVDLVFFYDTTSVYWEIEEDDEVRTWKRPPKDAEPLRLRGYTKDSRPDAPQIVIAMAVTRDGFPVRSWIFPGNTPDITTIERVKKDLNAWKLNRCVLVGDRGMTSAKNLKTLTGGGGGYILGVPMRRGEPKVKNVLARAGRFRVVRDNLQVKEIWYPAEQGARSERYVICYNPAEARRDHHRRQELLEELESELETMWHKKPQVRQQRIHELMSNSRYKPFLRETVGGKLSINRRSIAREAALDGKYLITTTDQTLSAEDIALGYKHLQQIERSWRTLKTTLEIRPVRHYAPRRIRAHVRIAQLALTLTRLVEVQASTTWSEAQMVLNRVHSAPLDHGLLGTTPAPESVHKLLAKLKIPSIPRVMPLSAHPSAIDLPET